MATALETPVESRVGSLPEPALGFAQAEAEEGPLPEESGDLRQAELPWELDRRLMALCQERGPLRSVLSRVACRLVELRAWERLGYARLSDYAVECLGFSARWVRDLAQVAQGLLGRPRLEDALVSGTLGWTKVRLLARLPREEEDEGAWIAYAREVTAGELSKQVRAVDRGSVEAGAAEEEGARGRRFEVRCTPEVRWKWEAARGAARRAAGRVLHPSEAAELVAAEVLSALPIDTDGNDGPCEEEGVSWSREAERCREGKHAEAESRDTVGSGSCGTKPPSGDGGAARDGVRPPWRRKGTDSPSWSCDLQRPSLPPALKALVEGLETADAFALDDRLRRALSMEQRLDARIGPLLARAWRRPVHRALSYVTREAYARERLGMAPSRARALVRLERAAVESASFARGYRTGALSWVKAEALLPLVSADPLELFIGEWVAWARRVTVRRFRDDVERALALSETDPAAFRRDGGLPREAQGDRQIGATEMGAGGNPWAAGSRGVESLTAATNESGAGEDRQIGATEMGVGGNPWAAGSREIEPYPHHHPEPLKSAPRETCWACFIGPSDVARLFRAVLCTVRRRLEPELGRLPTEGEALEVMLDHCFEAWGALDEKLARRYKVFARDGWRCAAPGCTSMQSLHDHHIRFRSAQGPDDLENRITLCAFHHLRGVHRGLLRCVGRAPDGLRWELGIRPGVTPRLAYRSGDIRIR